MTAAPKTVRVRIAVAVAPDGTWTARGWQRHGEKFDQKEVMEFMIEDLVDDNFEPLRGEARFWIEADLPLPETPTVAGDVKPA